MAVPAEHVERSRSGDSRDQALVQCNVRIPRWMYERLDARRQSLGLSRDEWARRVFEWALLQPPGTTVRDEEPERPRRRTTRR